MGLPTYDNLLNPLIKTLHELGGSGSISEITDRVAILLKLTEEDISEIHSNSGNRTELDYRLAWARNYLKRYGILENSARGIWAFTSEGKQIKKVDPRKVKRDIRVAGSKNEYNPDIQDERGESDTPDSSWSEQLLETIQNMPPDAFERLCQRVLREAGFLQVVVTGRTGDGGIDGKGILRIGGFISFHTVFQCKRYVGTVSSHQVREFRGAIGGRADKGILITTGSFTRNAKEEAVREGAQQVDLIDGEQLVEKIKELNLGVSVTTQEVVSIDKQWFMDI